MNHIDRIDKLKGAGFELLQDNKDSAILGYLDVLILLEKDKSIIVARKRSINSHIDFYLMGTYCGNDDKAIEYIKKIAR